MREGTQASINKIKFQCSTEVGNTQKLTIHVIPRTRNKIGLNSERLSCRMIPEWFWTLQKRVCGSTSSALLLTLLGPTLCISFFCLLIVSSTVLVCTWLSMAFPTLSLLLTPIISGVCVVNANNSYHCRDKSTDRARKVSAVPTIIQYFPHTDLDIKKPKSINTTKINRKDAVARSWGMAEMGRSL